MCQIATKMSDGLMRKISHSDLPLRWIFIPRWEWRNGKMSKMLQLMDLETQLLNDHLHFLTCHILSHAISQHFTTHLLFPELEKKTRKYLNYMPKSPLRRESPAEKKIQDLFLITNDIIATYSEIFQNFNLDKNPRNLCWTRYTRYE